MQTQTPNTTTPTKTPSRLLVDSRPARLQLVEGSETGGKVMLRGEFARCGIATENKRVYPEELWKREIGRLGKAMESRKLYGELDHPSDGRTKLQRVSHLVTNLEIRDGVVFGEAEVLDTEAGRNLKAILQAGGSCGISSRGFGETRTNDKGEEVVQNNYRLQTFDFVADPADQSAYPDVFYEHKEDDMVDEAKMAEDFAKKLEQANREGREAAEAALREEFARETISQLAALRAQLVEQVRGELLSDPSVGGARTALEKIKDVLRPFVLPEDAQAVAAQKDAEIAKFRNQIAEQALKIGELLDENAKLASVAKEAGYRYFVERNIAADPDSELIRTLIGDVTVYKNSTELKTKIESVRAELSERREKEAALAEEVEARKTEDRERKEQERARALKAERALREENSKLQEALGKAMTANKLMSVQLYAEARLANHPKAAKIRGIMESRTLQSKEEVDTILSKFREKADLGEDVEAVRARVRAATRGGYGSSPAEEEPLTEEGPSIRRPQSGVFGELGVNVGELRRLAGMTDKAPVSKQG